MHMTDVKTKVNVIGILGILGAILMVICVFLEWGSIEMTIWTESGAYAFSGWDLYSDKALISTTFLGQDLSLYLSDLELTSYSYVPLVTLVCGIIGLIASILPVASSGSKTINKIFGIVALLLAVVSIVLMALYMTDLSYSGGYEGLATATVGASYGVYIGIVGAVLMVLGGIGDIARKTN